jgi:hypothetical protein
LFTLRYRKRTSDWWHEIVVESKLNWAILVTGTQNTDESWK